MPIPPSGLTLTSDSESPVYDERERLFGPYPNSGFGVKKKEKMPVMHSFIHLEHAHRDTRSSCFFVVIIFDFSDIMISCMIGVRTMNLNKDEFNSSRYT